VRFTEVKEHPEEEAREGKEQTEKTLMEKMTWG
jgi:hypothetical protein